MAIASLHSATPISLIIGAPAPWQPHVRPPRNGALCGVRNRLARAGKGGHHVAHLGSSLLKPMAPQQKPSVLYLRRILRTPRLLLTILCNRNWLMLVACLPPTPKFDCRPMITVLAIAVACGAFLRLCVASPYEDAFGLGKCDVGGLSEGVAQSHDSDGNGQWPSTRGMAADH